MRDLLISINDKIFSSSEIKYQSDLDGTIIRRPDGKQWEIKYNYKKHKLYLKKCGTTLTKNAHTIKWHVKNMIVYTTII